MEAELKATSSLVVRREEFDAKVDEELLDAERGEEVQEFGSNVDMHERGTVRLCTQTTLPRGSLKRLKETGGHEAGVEGDLEEARNTHRRIDHYCSLRLRSGKRP